MQQQVLEFFQTYPHLAVLISLAISVVVAVLGLIPSFFVTAANILFFGFWQGTLISFLGEAIGAAIAFIIYRAGFKKMAQKSFHKYPKLQTLLSAEGKQAFILIFSLRLMPFVPSGLITFAGAVGKVAFITFIIASSLGKIPALFMEAYSANEVMKFEWQGKLILFITALLLLIFIFKKNKDISK